MKQFSENIFIELFELVKIDGCGEICIFWSVVFLIVKLGFAVFVIFIFINIWNDYFMQLVMLILCNNLIILFGVVIMQVEMVINYGLIMVGAVFAVVLIVIVFLVF